MATIICSRCTKTVETDGVVPHHCPFCGFTLGIIDDSTGRGGDHSNFPLTVIEPVDLSRKTIGKYVLKSELGSGAFGKVFLARDPELNRLVAIKVPRFALRRQREVLDRFGREARSAAQLQHPGIVALYAVEHEADLVYIVCEYVEGEPLSARIDRGPVSFLESATVVAAVAEAVEFAHSKRIVHRDIKPGNILIGVDGKPRLTDFGLAKQLTIDESLTADNQVLGTPAYMSPEQAAGDQSLVDVRTDIYSLGMVLYHLLTGRLPFRGDKRLILHQVLGADPPRLRSLNDKIPRDLEAVCLKAIEKEPSRRYPSAGDLAADLERWLRGDPVEVRHVGRVELAWHWCRQNPLTAGLLSSIAALLLATALVSIALYGAEAKALQAKEKELQAEANAHQHEMTLRQQIEETRKKERELLARAYIEKAERHLHPGHDLSEYNPLRALPWLYAALEVDAENPQRRDAARIRLQRQLDFAPRVERLWLHSGGIMAASVSPTGNVFATAGRDGQAQLWDIAAAAPLTRPLVHASPVTATVFSPDGASLATGAQDGVRVWEVATGKLKAGPLHPAPLPKQAPVRDRYDLIRFSDSSRWLVASNQGAAQIWNAATGASAGPPLTAPASFASAGFADSETVLAMFDGRDEAAMRMWDIQSGKERRDLEAVAKGLPPVAIVRDGGASVDGRAGDSMVVLWNCETRAQQGPPLIHHAAQITGLRFSPDHRFLATITSDGAARLWDVATGRLQWRRQFFTGQTAQLEFSTERPLLAVVHPYRGVVVVDVESGHLVAQPINAETRLNYAGWAASGRILTATDDGAIRLWSLESSEPAFLYPNDQPLVHTVVSDDRQVIAALDADGNCMLLRPAAKRGINAEEVKTFPTNTSVGAAALTRDGSKLAIANDFDGSDATVSIFDTTSHQRLGDLLPHDAALRAVRFTPDGAKLACLTHNQLVTVWDVAQSLKSYAPFRIDGRIAWGLDIDPAGRLCAVVAGTQVTVFDLGTGQRAGPVITHEKVAPWCRFFKDGQTLLTGDADGKAYVWEIATGRSHGTTGKHQRQITCLDVAADDSVFLTGSAAGTARLWSAKDASPVPRLLEHRPIDAQYQAEILHGVIDPQGRWIATVAGKNSVSPAADSQVYGWDAQTGELLFVRNLRHLQARFPARDANGSTNPSAIALVCFAPDGKQLRILGATGLFVTIDLEPDERSLQELRTEVAIRSGLDFDSSGGLKILDIEELRSIWKQQAGDR